MSLNFMIHYINFTKLYLEHEVDDDIVESVFIKINGLKNKNFLLPVPDKKWSLIFCSRLVSYFTK